MSRRKRDTVEPPPVFDKKIDKFKYWFVNVYWFHYRWHTLAVIIAVALTASILTTVLSHRDPDIVVVGVSLYPMDYEASMRLQTAMAEYMGDVNGDGKAIAEVLTINYGDPVTEVASRMMLAAQAQREETIVFIFDSYSRAEIEESMPLRDISEFYPNAGKFVDISASTLVMDMAMYKDLEFFAAIVDRERYETARELEAQVKAIGFFIK